ncbi:acyl-CoA dehydrogenase family protein [Asaia krungthepensis]|uniref:Dibenzothiophene monooxygenase n=1 Tax=Asaia krungthepensis NRIC 0535 TaxID=1307925 RepID=A0ABQ0Q6T7_9PROT|nr:acyl-CoA dehydrogenase family protein [Asaia krungthepensis]GBQ93967.1 acyl-CoA dehydrogenase [Asaia krungthepensis NRIC 0535]
MDFTDIFRAISESAVLRDRERAPASQAVSALAEAGFGRLRLSADDGGKELSLTAFFRLLRDLASADSNIPQIFRAHFAFVETLRAGLPDAARWRGLIRDNRIFGAAMAERGNETSVTTEVTDGPNGLVLNGRKYYSTGTLYADWIIVWASLAGDRVRVLVPADAPGVTRVDDWDGFGQRLTGSGTTLFEQVAIAPTQIVERAPADTPPSQPFLGAYYQQFHNTTLAGIAQAVLRDALAFVRPRERVFGVPGKSVQKHDPVVQGVVGRLSSLAYSTAVLADQGARALEAIEPLFLAGHHDDDAIERAQEEIFKAQQIIAQQTLEAATLLFEVGGASATSETLRLDRHWRNARTLASHNPAAQRQRELGDVALNGTRLWTPYRDGLRRLAEANQQGDAA